MPSPQVFFRRWTTNLFLILFLTGCQGKSGSRDESAEAQHIGNAWNFCRQYADVKKKRPDSIDDVKEWAVKEGKATENDFVSTRDKEPYGVAPSPMGANQVFVYEQTGKNGQCYMLVRGNATELSREDLDRQIESFQSLNPGGGKARGRKTR
jgi:hypothetical protein